MKLKTKIVHSFDIETEILETLDFNFNIPNKDIKKKTVIIEEKHNKKSKKNGTSRLF